MGLFNRMNPGQAPSPPPVKKPAQKVEKTPRPATATSAPSLYSTIKKLGLIIGQPQKFFETANTNAMGYFLTVAAGVIVISLGVSMIRLQGYALNSISYAVNNSITLGFLLLLAVIAAALLHAGAMMAGARGFGKTFAIVLYAQTAYLAYWLVIPLLSFLLWFGYYGFFLAPVAIAGWTGILIAIGMHKMHRLPVGSAIATAIIPTLFLGAGYMVMRYIGSLVYWFF